MAGQNTKWEKIFYRELLNHTLTIPDLLLDLYPEIGLTEENLVDLLKIMRYVGTACESFGLGEILPAFDNDQEKALAVLGFLQTKKIIDHNNAATPGEMIYNLTPLFDTLWEIWAYAQSRAKGNINGNSRAEKTPKIAAKPRPKTKDGFTTVYQAFEREMARPLSPYEGNQIADWLDRCGYQPEVVLEALKRAVLYGKYNFAYIDKILLSWQKNHLQTLPQIEDYEANNYAKKEKGRTPSGKQKQTGRNLNSNMRKSDFELLLAKSVKDQEEEIDG